MSLILIYESRHSYRHSTEIKALLIETASVLTPIQILCIAKQEEKTAMNGRLLSSVDTLSPLWGRSSTTGSKALTLTPGNYYK